MNSLELSFSKLSPRLMGYIAGFIWLWSAINNAFSDIQTIIESYFIYDVDADYSFGYATPDYTEYIFIATALIVGLTIGIGLIKNHPKIIIAGIIL